MSKRLRARITQFLNPRARVAVEVGLLIFLAACGGGGGGDAGGSSGGQNGTAPPVKTPLATAASRLFPLDTNGVAIYSTSAGNESVVVRVAGTQMLADQQKATVLRRQDPKGATDSYRAYVLSDAGLRQYSAAGANAIDRAFDGSYVMRWPAYAGDSHVQLDTTVDSGMDFDGDGRSDRVGLRAEVTVLGLENVTTPAGFFSNALHQQEVLKQTVHPSSGKADQQLITTTDTWYVSGVGIVRQVQAEQGVGVGGPVTQSLVKYRFGTLTNHSDLPFLKALQPALGSHALASAKVVATFSEEMDENSFTSQTFSVTDPDGKAVAGALRVSGRTVSFIPAQVLSNGSYRVVIGAAVQDLFGRHPTNDWVSSFFADASPPQVVSTSPRADALNVELGANISVNLSEAPGSASVHAGTVQLTLNGATVPATVRAFDSGISIDPIEKLERGRRYEVSVNGVTDRAGNPMAQGLRFGFGTTPGRFGSPERLPAPANGSIGADSLAAGDVNGDGIPDIVYSDEGDDGYPDAVYFRAGRADGQLNPPIRLNLSTYFQARDNRRCPISAVAIGDLTGDGRADVAVSSWNCGVLVLGQTVAGGLEPGQFIDELIQVLRVADINGDGRLDLVGVQNYWNKAFVWLQKTDGKLLLDQTPGLGEVAGFDVAIGDIDGDGRQDLVVAIGRQIASANIAILLQQADGRFAPPRYLSAGQSQGIWAVAVGDFNGDGRLDIAGTTMANQPASIQILQQAADGSFPTVTELPTLDGAWSVLPGDVNGDGRMDLVVRHEGWSKVGIYLQSSSGMLAPEEFYDAPGRSVYVQALALADLNRDGLLDIIGSGSVLRQVPLAGSGALGAATQALRKAPVLTGSK